MILNPFKCEECGEELQPEDIQVGISENNELMRKCRFCGYEKELKEGEKEK